MSSRSGGLLELVARGKKDVFFTANPVTRFFHSVYTRSSPFVKEIHVMKPRNIPEWGRYVDFDLEHRGDFIKNVYLRLELPTWLPASASKANRTGIVTDLSGVTYGYTNNIGFQILDKIQFFQDQVLISETYGELLEWRLRQSYTNATTYVLGEEIGSRNESALAIGRSATPPVLRIPIPILGWQALKDPGIPMLALKNQRFRIRIHLRKLEEVIVASDGRLRPQPWNGIPLSIQYVKDGPIDTSQITEPFSVMKTLGVSLETTQMYVMPDVQLFIKSQTLRIPYASAQFQQYTIEDNQMTAAALSSSVFNFPMKIDFIGSTERMLLGFRSEACTLAGQRTQLSAVPNTIRLNIANIDRLKQWLVPVLREVTSYWKHARMALDMANPDLPQEVYTLTFGGMDRMMPAGTFNLTRASQPNLYITLNSFPYDIRTIRRTMYALLYAETWNVFEIRNGKGQMMFDDT